MQGAMQGRAAQVLRPQCAASAASRRAGARCLGLSDLRPAPALAHPAALHRLSPLSRRHTAASRQRRVLVCAAAVPRPWKEDDARLVLADGRVPCCGPAQPLHFRLRLKRAAGRALAGSRTLRSVRALEFQGEASGHFFGSGGQYIDRGTNSGRTAFSGVGFGAKGCRVGEVVFNTSLTGYQEIMSDPSYAGQMVCFTGVHIGNTGMNAADMESGKAWLDGIIVRNLAPLVSNWRSEQDLDGFCKQHNVIGIAEVDTRALTRKLRDTGAMVGVICTDSSISDATLLEKARAWKLDGLDMISVVSTKEKYTWSAPSDAEWEFMTSPPAGGPFKVVALDFGVKKNILRRLAAYGCDVTVVPASTSAADIFALNPDGVFLSNGPGDPSAVPYAVESTKAFIGKLPVFGICMGHQVLGQAFGGVTYKLKFGHHGGNHPIRYIPTGRIEVSAQNHNYAVDVATLPKEVTVTHINLNDGTCAGMVWEEKRAMSIQYHPEAGPGPHDSDVNFRPFVEWMAAAKAASKAAR